MRLCAIIHFHFDSTVRKSSVAATTRPRRDGRSRTAVPRPHHDHERRTAPLRTACQRDALRNLRRPLQRGAVRRTPHPARTESARRIRQTRLHPEAATRKHATKNNRGGNALLPVSPVPAALIRGSRHHTVSLNVGKRHPFPFYFSSWKRGRDHPTRPARLVHISGTVKQVWNVPKDALENRVSQRLT